MLTESSNIQHMECFDANNSISRSYNSLKEIWSDKMGADTWPIFEACIATTCSLYLKEMRQPLCMIIKGKSSSGKTTILNMFKNLPGNLAEYIDEVSAAGFVSQSGKVGKEQLAEIDLLPRLKNRLLITPEMGTMFSRNENDLRQNFGTLLRILDGDGLTRHGGIHGTRAYVGEYKFVFLAATVTVPSNAWAMMRESGTRILFMQMPEMRSKSELIQKMESQLSGGGITATDIKELQKMTHDHFEIITNLHPIRSLPLPIIPRTIANKLISLSILGTRLRSEIARQSSREDDSYTEKEEPFRLMHQLSHIMFGQVIARGGNQVEEQDYQIAKDIALDSAPECLGNITKWLLGHNQSTLKHVCDQVSYGETKTSELLKDLVTLEVVNKTGEGSGSKAHYTILPEWQSML